MSDPRFDTLQQWLERGLGLINYRLAPASEDASFRRYFRVYYHGMSLIVMDAPPEQEDCRSFIHIAKEFRGLGLNVPEVLEQNLEQGLLLLTDLGEYPYLRVLNSHNASTFYGDALVALRLLQGGESDLPSYDQDLLLKEMRLFQEWYLEGHLGIEVGTSLDKVFERLAASALEQPRVLVHRDYHSRNLMVTEQANPGILDFQDAVKGPVTYDLVSLLRDCYIAWPRDWVLVWLYDYRRQAARAGIPVGASEAEFLRWFDWMGVQRHLKAIGIFARLNARDGKSGYLKDIPRTLDYLRTVVRQYGELADLDRVLRDFSNQ
ncbi:aminoglycoside phosphotransferase family protein [Nitrosococcus watsonii]|uniref:Aminoglycoside phosphotransferase n=1 Tax=Nitrosococcus watsoni (strain C-113) TaxID=105559 RepID=D8KBQ0_NITWC|nr:phosphotransferase [Nitrosococcus watsonii]ADJ27661.1 aminoglycoside phosphotransferase [Nitrosococcus watsonii C-113]